MEFLTKVKLKVGALPTNPDLRPKVRFLAAQEAQQGYHGERARAGARARRRFPLLCRWVRAPHPPAIDRLLWELSMRPFLDQREFVKVLTILLRRAEFTIPVSLPYAERPSGQRPLLRSLALQHSPHSPQYAQQ